MQIVSIIKTMHQSQASIAYLEGGAQGQIRPHEKIPDHDILLVGFTLEKCMSNKGVISTFKFECSHLILKEEPKVKGDHMISYMLVYHPKLLGSIISEL